jgi:hypothetical protein
LDQHCVHQGLFDPDRGVWGECPSRTGPLDPDRAQFGLPSHVIEANGVGGGYPSSNSRSVKWRLKVLEVSLADEAVHPPPRVWQGRRVVVRGLRSASGDRQSCQGVFAT